MGDLFSNLFGNKPWFHSLTAWGLVIFVGATAIVSQTCEVGLLSPAACETATGLTGKLGIVLTALGIRKAATTTNTRVG